jgi:transposase
MKPKIEVRQIYSEEFKRKVIEEYLSTGCSKLSLLHKYHIRYKSAIQKWMKLYGYSDVKFKSSSKFDPIKTSILPGSTKEELKNRIKALEKQLEEEKLRSDAFSRVIEIAEKELHIPIRKKFNTK